MSSSLPPKDFVILVRATLKSPSKRLIPSTWKRTTFPVSNEMSATAKVGSRLVVYGHYVSQPSRAVLWLLKIHNHPFEFKKVEPLAGDTRRDEFRSKFPTGLAPAIDDDGFCLAEGSAIMQYLCEKHEWTQWWPLGQSESERRKRAKISEYLSHHHHSDRLISHKIIRPSLEEVFFKKPTNSQDFEKRQASALKSVRKFQDTFLRETEFVNDQTHPTIADLVAYAEVGQLLHLNILSSFDELPRAKQWVEKMQSIPSHDDVHKTARKVGEMIRNIQIRQDE
jgi:glutathione S-transferase